MKSFAFFALFLLAATASAQTPAEQIAKLQKDPNIIWIGEIYRDYEDLDKIYEGRNIDRTKPITLSDGTMLHNHKQSSTFLKLQNSNSSAFRWEHYLINQVIAADVKAFDEPNLAKPLTTAQKTARVVYVDTISVYDPEKKKFDTTVVKNELDPDDIYGYRLRQLVYYNAKENMYYNLPLSIAPLKSLKLDNGEILNVSPLFWLPVVVSSTPINPSKAPSMPFIKSVQMHLPFADAKALKETKKATEINLIWIEQMANQKDKLFAVGFGETDNENNKSLLPQEFYNILKEPDTLEVFDPETFVATPVVTKRFDVVDLRINQTFGWDDKKKTLTISTYSIAPIVNRYDDRGNLLLTTPLFYLYPHRWFKTVPK
jgi:hypothetical protein